MQHENTCNKLNCFCQRETYYNAKTFNMVKFDKN